MTATKTLTRSKTKRQLSKKKAANNSTASQSLEQLLAQAQVLQGTSAGDRAFEDFVLRIDPFLAYVASRKLPPGHEIEDVKQLSVMQIWLGLQSYHPGRPVRPWVGRIVHNVAVSLFRHQRRRAIAYLPDLKDVAAEEQQAPEVQELYRLLALLPEHARAVIEKRHLEGLSLSEIADDLQIPLGVVGNRIHYWLNRLKQWAAVQNAV